MRIWKHNGKLLLLVVATILLGWMLLSLAAQQAAAGPQAVQASDLSWNVLANGGATMSSPSYTIMGTVGQPVVGESTSGSYGLISGYWSSFASFVEEIFLPIIRSKS